MHRKMTAKISLTLSFQVSYPSCFDCTFAAVASRLYIGLQLNTAPLSGCGSLAVDFAASNTQAHAHLYFLTVNMFLPQHDKCRLLHWCCADLFWCRFGEDQSCAATCYGHFWGDIVCRQWVHPAFYPWGEYRNTTNSIFKFC